MAGGTCGAERFTELNKGMASEDVNVRVVFIVEGNFWQLQESRGCHSVSSLAYFTSGEKNHHNYARYFQTNRFVQKRSMNENNTFSRRSGPWTPVSYTTRKRWILFKS